MKPKILPKFPDAPTPVTYELEFGRQGDSAYYFFRGMPVFSHALNDVASFRMITAQFCVNRHASEEEIARAFGVSIEDIKVAVELYRAQGVDGFYAPPARTRNKTRNTAGS